MRSEGQKIMQGDDVCGHLEQIQKQIYIRPSDN